MGTSSSVFGKGNRFLDEPLANPTPGMGQIEKRLLEDAPAITIAGYISVVQEHAQWWNPELKPKMEALQSSVVEGVDGAVSAWVADECNRVLRQELLPDEEKLHSDLAQEGKLRELAAWKKSDAYTKRNEMNTSKQIAQTRWVLSWKMVARVERAMARPAAKGFQGPELKAGLVDVSGCVSLRSSHLQVVPISALQKWKLWSLDIKNASLHADGFDRDVRPHAPDEWEPTRLARFLNLKAPAYGLNDAQIAFRRSLKRVSTSGPCLFFVFRDSGHAAGVFTSHIDDIFGRGEPEVLTQLRHYLERRFAGLKLQESSFLHVGAELAQDKVFSAALTQGEFTRHSQPLPATRIFWASRQTL